MSTALPLVSCIMPTYNRRAFVPLAVRYFLRQDYPNKELIVVDDGTDPVEDLMPAEAQIRYLRLTERLALGAKRNLACDAAQGQWIIHWDDDDWSAPGRISYQVQQIEGTAAEICGLRQVLFYAPEQHRAWEYAYPHQGRAWVYGASLCYRKAFWRKHPFPGVTVGEDTRFVWADRNARIHVLPDHHFLVSLVHPGNTSPKRTAASIYRPQPVERVQRLLGDDLPHYQPAAGATLPRADSPLSGTVIPPAKAANRLTEPDWPPPAAPTDSPTPMEPMTIARKADLLLPEFAAFNHGQNLPWMRRWELPFALCHARLGNTGAVLDASINPAGFGERLARLYPHVLYRHSSPIQNGHFVSPLGLPDESFDRVFCINALEHLLRAQRQELLAALARKLKPGGLLILTSDFYFDSAWQRAEFLQSGVTRADRQEVFNGFNKVTMAEWAEFCRPHGLLPECPRDDLPVESDSTLYLNQPPHVHACIGGVFYKEPRPQFAGARTIVLALLTWNTRQVSLESLEAYLREAHLLARLGHRPHLCICDNGSTDGTPAALQAFAEKLTLPHRLLLNPQNRGNSIARNQIIDYLQEVNGDYLMFMDGDIEVVPFSSVALLRHMENCGSQLGCIGANSAGQTPHRSHTSPCLYAIDPAQVRSTNLVAWTQYGMFRRQIFNAGVRFDENTPFNGPGWGFEDNDLAFQMETKGFANQYFGGMVYLHRAAHSSLRILREQGHDPLHLYRNRKQYVIQKWDSVPAISQGPLRDVRQVEIRI
jgi:glycosyltransferase involved in cell wall biosynthesis/SAM-dependent methyltransferase